MLNYYVTPVTIKQNILQGFLPKINSIWMTVFGGVQFRCDDELGKLSVAIILAIRGAPSVTLERSSFKRSVC